MFLSARSHMPIFPFILVDDDFMIQECKNNTSLALEHSAISKRVLVITHILYIQAVSPSEMVTWISVCSLFMERIISCIHLLGLE